MTLLKTVTQSELPAKTEPRTGFCIGATVRLKEAVGGTRDNTRIARLLESIDGAVLLEEALDGSTIWSIQDLDLMNQKGVFESVKTPAPDKVFVVYVPANVYTGRYHSYGVAQVKVLASSKDDAVSILNGNHDDVLRFLSTRRVQPSGRPLLPAKAPAKKNVFFKDTYYTKELPVRSSNDVLTRHGGFKAVRLSKINESVNSSSPNEVAVYLYTLLKNSKEGRRADWEAPTAESPTRAEFSCRYFGTWEVPADEEDDGDYDWEVPTQFTIKQIDHTIKTATQRYPAFKVDVSVGEKNWLTFSVTPRS